MHCIFWGASVDFLFYTSPQGFTFLSVCFVSFSISLLFAKALVFNFMHWQNVPYMSQPWRNFPAGLQLHRNAFRLVCAKAEHTSRVIVSGLRPDILVYLHVNKDCSQMITLDYLKKLKDPPIPKTLPFLFVWMHNYMKLLQSQKHG